MDVPTAIDRVINTLQNNLTDPISASRVGSYIFGPDQDITYLRALPKVQVTFGPFETGRENMSFGQNKKKDKEITFSIWFYNKRGDVFTSGTGSRFINGLYTHEFMRLIEDTLGSNLQSMGLHGLVVGTVDGISYNKDQQIHLAELPINFQWRK